MSRPRLTDDQKRLGRALGKALQRHRGGMPTTQVASEAGVSLDVLRKLEQGSVATPGFFLVARIAAALQIPLDDLAAESAANMEHMP